MAIREGAWDCTTCGRIGNRGPEKFCAGCGHPRGPEIELYLPDEAPEITDEAALERALAGADWCCDHCGGDNHADAGFCTGCGAPGTDAERRPVVVHRTSSAKQNTGPPAATPVRRPGKARRKQLKRDYRRRSAGLRNPFALGCLLLVAVAALLAWLGRTSDTTATVGAFAWERTIAVERLVPVTEEAKPDELPAGARLLETDAGEKATRTVTERIQVGTERAKVGVRDLGNGFFEDIYEERPVYETRRREVPTRGPPRATVRYQIDRWTVVREARSSGRDRSPSWPDPALAAGEREGSRSATYTVLLSAPDGETLTYRTADEDEWNRFSRGARYKVEATRDGRIRSLDPR